MSDLSPEQQRVLFKFAALADENGTIQVADPRVSDLREDEFLIFSDLCLLGYFEAGDNGVRIKEGRA